MVMMKNLSTTIRMLTLATGLLLGLNGCALGQTRAFQGTPAAAMAQAVCGGRVATLKRLVGEGGDINALDRHDMSLLYLAVRCGRVDTFRTLLAAGAKPVAGSDGEPIMSAVAKRNHAVPFLTALFDAGVSPNAGVGARASPLENAIGHDKLSGDRYAERMIKHGADLNHQDAAGETPLFYAATFYNFAMIRTLIKAGADPSLKDNSGQTFQAYLNLDRPKSTYSKQFLEKYQALRGFLRAHDIPVTF